MTQRKKIKPTLKDFKADTFFVDGAKDATQLDLRSMFKNIPADEQQAIINFFNLHNAAIWIYNKLSASAMEYVELSIKLSQEQISQ